MTGNESDKFKIRIDDESLEEPIHEDMVDSRINRLNKRTLFISIIIPFLICIILFFAYRDLSTKISRFNDTGTTKVRTLSKDLESRFSSLNLKQAKIEDELKKKIEAIIKTTGALQKGLKEATTAIKYIRIARRKDNNKIAANFKSIDETLAPLPKKLETIASGLTTIDHKFTNNFNTLTKTINGLKDDLLKVKAGVDSISSAKIDKKTFETALKNEQIVNQKNINRITKKLTEQINYLKEKLNKLEGIKGLTKSKTKTKSQKSSATKSTIKTEIPKTVTKPKSPNKETILPKPGTIIEQDVK